jgi:plasmid maintenance system antidote protein VapI
LRDLIVESGMTHQQIADAMGVPQTKISVLIRQGTDMRMSTAIKLCSALNISLKALAASKQYDVTALPDDCGDDKINGDH